MVDSMLGKRLRYLFSLAAAKGVAEQFLQALGVLWLVLEISDFFFHSRIELIRQEAFYLVLLIALLWSLGRSFPPLFYRKRSKASNIVIEVAVGDLLEEPSNIAFGCSECFDTEPETVIGSQSLMAQLMRAHFSGNHNLLDKAVSDSLRSQGISGVLDPAKKFGKNIRYPIGTVAVINAKHGKALLVAFSLTKSDKTTVTSKEDLWASLCKLWATVKQEGFLGPIAVPLFGAGLAGFPASRVSLTQLLILSFVIATRESIVSRKLRLIIHRNDYDPEEMREAIGLLETLDF